MPAWVPASVTNPIVVLAPTGDTFLENYRGFSIWQHSGGGTFYIVDSANAVVADGLLSVADARAYIDALLPPPPPPNNLGIWVVAGILGIVLVSGKRRGKK